MAMAKMKMESAYSALEAVMSRSRPSASMLLDMSVTPKAAAMLQGTARDPSTSPLVDIEKVSRGVRTYENRWNAMVPAKQRISGLLSLDVLRAEHQTQITKVSATLSLLRSLRQPIYM